MHRERKKTGYAKRRYCQFSPCQPRAPQQEVFAVVFLNRGNKITHLEIVSEGGITGTIADPRVILKKALEHNATALILCHNHPSGNTRPSKADEAVTQKIKQAASLLDIHIMDHIIVSSEGYFSFADEGLLVIRN
jgi:DNA repair protein RadC